MEILVENYDKLHEMEETIKFLHWNNSDSATEKAIECLAMDSDMDLNLLIQPVLGKGYWDNCAEVLRRKGYPIIEPVTKKLFEWLQDMNWPGSETIYKLLKTYPKICFMKYYINAIMSAITDKDEDWLYWLARFVHDEFVSVNDFEDVDIYNRLIELS